MFWTGSSPGYARSVCSCFLGIPGAAGRTSAPGGLPSGVPVLLSTTNLDPTVGSIPECEPAKHAGDLGWQHSYGQQHDVCESFFSALKREMNVSIGVRSYREAELLAFDYIDNFYIGNDGTRLLLTCRVRETPEDWSRSIIICPRKGYHPTPRSWSSS